MVLVEVGSEVGVLVEQSGQAVVGAAIHYLAARYRTTIIGYSVRIVTRGRRPPADAVRVVTHR